MHIDTPFGRTKEIAGCFEDQDLHPLPKTARDIAKAAQR
jgi:hypothetical protein